MPSAEAPKLGVAWRRKKLLADCSTWTLVIWELAPSFARKPVHVRRTERRSSLRSPRAGARKPAGCARRFRVMRGASRHGTAARRLSGGGPGARDRKALMRSAAIAQRHGDSLGAD